MIIERYLQLCLLNSQTPCLNPPGPWPSCLLSVGQHCSCVVRWRGFNIPFLGRVTHIISWSCGVPSVSPLLSIVRIRHLWWGTAAPWQRWSWLRHDNLLLYNDYIALLHSFPTLHSLLCQCTTTTPNNGTTIRTAVGCNTVLVSDISSDTGPHTEINTRNEEHAAPPECSTAPITANTGI